MECTQPKFETWLQSRGLDQQHWTPELLRSLRQRYERENPGMVAAKLATLKHGGDRKSDEIKGPIGPLNNSIAMTPLKN
jgi:hypothetical protein